MAAVLPVLGARSGEGDHHDQQQVPLLLGSHFLNLPFITLPHLHSLGKSRFQHSGEVYNLRLIVQTNYSGRSIRPRPRGLVSALNEEQTYCEAAFSGDGCFDLYKCVHLYM